MFSLILLL